MKVADFVYGGCSVEANGVLIECYVVDECYSGFYLRRHGGPLRTVGASGAPLRHKADDHGEGCTILIQNNVESVSYRMLRVIIFNVESVLNVASIWANKRHCRASRRAMGGVSESLGMAASTISAFRCRGGCASNSPSTSCLLTPAQGDGASPRSLHTICII